MQPINFKEIQGQLNLLQRFGQGSYGEVCKAEHRKSGKVVALKKVFKGAQNLVKHMPEIRAMKSCDSPYIVAYYGCEWLREDLLIAMELCEFGSLADVMKVRRRAFNEEQVAYIMQRTLKALAYLSSNKKVHRDIKPANIMLTAQGKIKLGDLGITKDLRPDGTLRDRIGSVLYLAPEIARDLPYTASVDVWSVGITAVELLLGRAPRSSERTKEILRKLVTEPQGPTIQLPNASPELLNFLNRCLQVDPSKRPSAADLLSDPFITKASSVSMSSVIIDMDTQVQTCGDFQLALQRAAGAKIELAPSTEESRSTDSDVEISAALRNMNDKFASPQVQFESTEEIDALVARPAMDSPVLVFANAERLNHTPFALNPHDPRMLVFPSH